jgi:hypothetical protein
MLYFLWFPIAKEKKKKQDGREEEEEKEDSLTLEHCKCACM